MTLQVNSRIDPRLEGRGRIRFKTKHSLSSRRSLSYNDQEDHESQQRAVAELLLVFERFVDLCCEASMEAGVQDSEAFIRGEINAFVQTAVEASQALVREVADLTRSFSETFPNSSFTITLAQGVTSAELHPHRDH